MNMDTANKTLVEDTSVQNGVPPPKRVHLAFLDGMRGLAALYVVCYHAYLEFAYTEKPASRLAAALWQASHIFAYGHLGVGVFIVLSGYCLMLPVVRSREKCLRGGIWDFVKRRARRILPPYYAALGLSLLMIAAFPLLRKMEGENWDFALPAFSPVSVLTHLFLLHDLSFDLIYKINPPFWSVATEWHIYFVFALLLLPIWRRWGSLATLVTAFAAGSAPHFLLRGTPYSLERACPWYIGLFALGMTAANLDFGSLSDRASRFLNRWAGLCALGFLCLIGLARARNQMDHLIVVDTLVGLTAACAIMYLTRKALLSANGNAGRPLLLRILESRGAVQLGTFSYSLYLIHDPLVVLFYRALRAGHCSVGVSSVALYCIGIPLTVAVAYGFHLLFERRFMSPAPRRA